MNTGELICQSLIDTAVTLSVAWIDQTDTDITASHVLEYTQGQLSRHFEALSAAEFLQLQQHVHDHGLLSADADTDMHMAVYDCVWNCIELELSKLYA